MFMNTFVFGFEMNFHVVWRILLMILAVAIGPIIAYLFLVGGLFFGSISVAYEYRILFFYLIA